MPFTELPLIKPFRYRNYRLLFISEICFFIPIWMAAMVFGLITTHIKGNSPFYVGLVGFGFNLPMLLGPLIGVIVDQHERPKILRMVSLTAFAAAFIMALVLMRGLPNFWILFLLVLIYGFSQAFYYPAILTNTTDIIDDPKIVGTATSIINSTNRIMMFLGYGLGGVLITYWSEQATYWFNAVLFILSYLFLISVKTTIPLATERRSVIHELNAGFSHIHTSPPVFAIVILLGLMGFLAWPYLFQIPVINRYYFNGSPATLGFLLSMGGVGGTVGAFFMSMRKSHLGLNRILIAGTLLLSVCLFLFAFCRSIFWAVPLLFLIDFGLMVTLTAGMILIQYVVPNELQGRLMGIISMVSFGTIPIGSTLFYGGIGAPFGVMTAFAVAGILLFVATLWYMTQLGKIRRYAMPIFIVKMLIKDEKEANQI